MYFNKTLVASSRESSKESLILEGTKRSTDLNASLISFLGLWKLGIQPEFVMRRTSSKCFHQGLILS